MEANAIAWTRGPAKEQSGPRHLWLPRKSDGAGRGCCAESVVWGTCLPRAGEKGATRLPRMRPHLPGVRCWTGTRVGLGAWDVGLGVGRAAQRDARGRARGRRNVGRGVGQGMRRGVGRVVAWGTGRGRVQGVGREVLVGLGVGRGAWRGVGWTGWGKARRGTRGMGHGARQWVAQGAHSGPLQVGSPTCARRSPAGASPGTCSRSASCGTPRGRQSSVVLTAIPLNYV